MKYTITEFRKDFPDDNACLDYIFKSRYKDFKCPVCGNDKFYRVKGRKQYSCRLGHHISPTAGTIFHKSDTKLTDWFFAIYLFSNTKNGTSAKELQRYLGCTYKTAWRIAYKVRSLMKQDDIKLSGTVEADETYIGGVSKKATHLQNKAVVMGIVERKGKIKTKHIADNSTSSLLGMLRDNVILGSRVITDENVAYKPNKIQRIGMLHDKVCHSKEEYVRGDVYTNTIEGFFS